MKDVYQDITNNFVEMIEETGELPWRKPWKEQTGNFEVPRNFSTKNYYNGINHLILLTNGLKKQFAYQDWITFKQAQALGAQVKKGSKSTRCIRVIEFEKEVEMHVLNASEPKMEKKQVSYFATKMFNVFNVEQVDGLEIESADFSANDYETDVDCINRLSFEYCKAHGINFLRGGNRAFYARTGNDDYIRLPNEFNSSEAYATTLAHELIHSTGHSKRLNRFEENVNFADFDEKYAEEELVAELGALFVCSRLHIKFESDNHVSYLKNWLKALKNDKKFIFQAASKASKAADFLLRYHKADLKKAC